MAVTNSDRPEQRNPISSAAEAIAALFQYSRRPIRHSQKPRAIAAAPLSSSREPRRDSGAKLHRSNRARPPAEAKHQPRRTPAPILPPQHAPSTFLLNRSWRSTLRRRASSTKPPQPPQPQQLALTSAGNTSRNAGEPSPDRAEFLAGVLPDAPQHAPPSSASALLRETHRPPDPLSSIVCLLLLPCVFVIKGESALMKWIPFLLSLLKSTAQYQLPKPLIN